jgi:hypothetical protein
VAQEAEVGTVAQVRDVVLAPGQEVVHAEDAVPFGEEALAEVRAQEAGAAGDDRPGAPAHERPSATLCSSTGFGRPSARPIET